MRIEPVGIPGLYGVRQERAEDSRGFFARQFCSREFRDVGIEVQWVQVNNSFSFQEGTLRGLHFQLSPFEEAKMIRCTRGAVWDVAVDLRPNSEFFGMWHGQILSEENRDSLYIPCGFAHGFQTLEANSEVMYLVSEFYSPPHEGALLWSDPEVAISWPAEPTCISEKDQRAATLSELRYRGLLPKSLSQ